MGTIEKLEKLVESAEASGQVGSLDRRDFLRTMGAGAGAAVLSSIPLEAEAQSRPGSLAGTPASLAKQIRMFRQDGLSMLHDKDLESDSFYRTDRRLVVVDRSTPHYYVEDVEFGNALARPYVSLFLQRLSEQFYKKFEDRLKVTSLTRSYEFQRELRHKNINATLPEKSPHVRGAGIDISYESMNRQQRKWMRDTLVELETKAGVLEATEEMAQSTFHIMVFKRYLGYVQRNEKMNDRNFAAYYNRMTGGRIY